MRRVVWGLAALLLASRPAGAQGLREKISELFVFTPRKDRATKLLRFISEVTVNGSPEMKGREAPKAALPAPPLPLTDLSQPVPSGLRV